MNVTTQKTVLCLHGWGSRPAVFEVQLRTLVKPLRDLGYHTQFVQAPCSLWIGKLDVVRTFGGPYFGWYQKETWATIKSAIKAVHEQYNLFNVDAIIGFSQGATLSLIIASLMEHGVLGEVLETDSWQPPSNLTNVPRSLQTSSFPVQESSDEEQDDSARYIMPRATTMSSINTRSSSLTSTLSSFSAASSQTSLDTSTNTLPSRGHKVQFILALCPISTAWSPADIKDAVRTESLDPNVWLPTIPVFFTAGESDKYKQHSLEMATKAKFGSEKHRVATYPFGHEVPRSIHATKDLLDFVKLHQMSSFLPSKGQNFVSEW